MISEQDRRFVHFAESADEVWTTLIQNGLIAPRQEAGGSGNSP
jgi:hypothetical protein